MKISNERNDIWIDIADDKLLATMTIKREQGVIAQEEILELIKTSGIKRGFISNIDDSHKKEIGVAFPIAQIDNEISEPKFELYFNDDEVYYSKLVLSEANVCKLVYLHKGSALGKLNISEDNLVLKNVLGEYIYNIEGDDSIVEKFKGTNVSFNYESKEYIADVNGYLYQDKNGRFGILTKIILEQNITEKYGNIYLLGDLVIKGSIENVKHIRVIGELIVEGNIINSNVYAEKSIFVTGEIRSCNNGGVSCNGDISCHDISKSKVFSGKKLEVFGKVTYSKLVGENKILVAPENEVIASDLYSAKQIVVHDVKNEGGTISNLDITVSPYTKEQLLLLTRELVYLTENKPGNEKIALVEDEIKELERRLSQKVEETIELEYNEGASLETTGQIYPKVSIRMLKHSTIVRDNDFKNKRINKLN